VRIIHLVSTLHEERYDVSATGNDADGAFVVAPAMLDGVHQLCPDALALVLWCSRL
jgi:hypothetical protein